MTEEIAPISPVHPDASSPSETGATSAFYVEVYDPENTPWEDIGNDVVETTMAAFYDDGSVPKDRSWLEQGLEMTFVNPDYTVVLARSRTTNSVLGYAFAGPHDLWEYGETTAYGRGIAIHPDSQRQGILPKLHELLVETLKSRGYEYLLVDARTKHGYNRLLSMIAGDKVVEIEEPRMVHGEEVQGILIEL